MSLLFFATVSIFLYQRNNYFSFFYFQLFEPLEFGLSLSMSFIVIPLMLPPKNYSKIHIKEEYI